MTLAEQQRKEDIVAIMRTPAGRRFLFSLVERTGLFSAGWADTDLLLSRAAGRRSIGEELLLELQAADKVLFCRVMTEPYDALVRLEESSSEP
jgi:hypothetical protein